VPGIEIHIQSVNGKYRNNIRIFADGSFYQMGIPPGKYIAYVDSTQLTILDASCDPPIRSFDVKITAEGDYIEGMKFLLNKRQAEKIISAMSDSIKDQSIITIALPEEKYQIVTHKKPKGFVIHISTWETERRARNEAKKFERDRKISTIIEKILVDGKSKYAVYIGVFSSKEKALVIYHKLRANK